MAEPEFHNLTEDQARYIRKLRETASARMVRVTTNNKFPHWNLERWLMVLLFVWGLLGGGASAVWFFATEWSTVKREVGALTDEMPEVRTRLEAVNSHLNILQTQISGQDRREEGREHTVIPRPSVPAPAFPRSEQFSPAAAEREGRQ